jgi:hypothetical protein
MDTSLKWNNLKPLADLSDLNGWFYCENAGPWVASSVIRFLYDVQTMLKTSLARFGSLYGVRGVPHYLKLVYALCLPSFGVEPWLVIQISYLMASYPLTVLGTGKSVVCSLISHYLSNCASRFSSGSGVIKSS